MCNVHYIPTYYFPHYQRLGYEKGLCPKAEKLYDEMMANKSRKQDQENESANDFDNDENGAGDE